MRELGIEFISVFGMDPRHSRPTSRKPYDRLTAGEGELPLLDILRAVPEDRVIGLEVPLRTRMAAGEDAAARLGRCMASARELIAQI